MLDLDQVAREVVARGQPALVEIAERWPAVVVNGALDRKALGAVIVADSAARRALEAITHPRIWERMEAWLAEQREPAVVEAALMVETGSWRRYDRLLVVACAPEVQRARLAAREGYDPATVERWLATQVPIADKVALADAVIWNDEDERALTEEVGRAWALVLSDAAKHRARD